MAPLPSSIATFARAGRFASRSRYCILAQGSQRGSPSKAKHVGLQKMRTRSTRRVAAGRVGGLLASGAHRPAGEVACMIISPFLNVFVGNSPLRPGCHEDGATTTPNASHCLAKHIAAGMPSCRPTSVMDVVPDRTASCSMIVQAQAVPLTFPRHTAELNMSGSMGNSASMDFNMGARGGGAGNLETRSANVDSVTEVCLLNARRAR